MHSNDFFSAFLIIKEGIIMPFILVVSPPVCLAISFILLERFPGKWRNSYWTLALAWAFFLYHYIPKGINDMSRYYDMVKSTGEMSFYEAISNVSDGLLGNGVLFYIIGKIGIPQLLPMFAVALSYGVMLYITCDSATGMKSEKAIFKVIFLQFLLLSMFDIAIVVRSGISYSFMILTLYLDLVKKKNKLFLFFMYILSSLFHTSALFFIFVRFIIAFLKNLRIRIVFSMIFIFLLSIVSKNEVLFKNTFINALFLKVNAYLNGNGSEWWSKYLSTNLPFQVYKYVVFLNVVILLYFLYIQIKVHKNIKNDSYEYCDLCLYLGIFVIVSGYIFPSNEFVRFYDALLIGSGAFLIPVYANTYKFNQMNLLFAKIFLFLGAVITKVYVIHIDSVSVDWQTMITAYFTKNGLSLIKDIIIK